jgi:localization factor PodJL
MSQSLSWNLDELEPEARDIARREARRAGMSVEDWLDMVMRDNAGHGARRAQPSRDDNDDDDGYDDRYEDPRAASAAASRFNASRLKRVQSEDLLAKAAANDRRMREAEARTAQMLDSITGWMEKAESRIRASELSASERLERTTSAAALATGTTGARLNEDERRAGSERRAFPELREAPDRRQGVPRRVNGLSRANLADAVAQIKARQRDLDDEPQRTASVTHLSAVPSRSSVPAGEEAEFRAMREELRALTESFHEARAPRHAARPSSDLRGELLRNRRDIGRDTGRDAGRGGETSTADIHDTLLALIARLDSQGNAESANGSDRMSRTLDRLEQHVAKLESGRGNGANGIERQVARLHQRLDQIANGPDGRGQSPLNRQAASLPEAQGANLSQSASLSQSISTLSDEIAALRKAQAETQSSPPQFAELLSAIDEIRSNSSPADNSSLLAHLSAIALRLEDSPRLTAAELETRIEPILDRVVAARGEDTGVSERIDALTSKLETFSHSPPESLERRIDALQEMIQQSTANAPNSPSLERQIEGLAARLENLAASNGLVQVLAKDGKPAFADLRPLEGSLRKIEEQVSHFERADPSDKIDALADRIVQLSERIDQPRESNAANLLPMAEIIQGIQERLERAQDGDSSGAAMRALEQQLIVLSQRMEERPASASDSGVDVTLRELLSAVESLRNDSVTATERGVRIAVATGLDELKATQGALENRLFSQFNAIQGQMERIAARLSTPDGAQGASGTNVADMLAAAVAQTQTQAPQQPAQTQARTQAQIEAPVRAEQGMRIEPPMRAAAPQARQSDAVLELGEPEISASAPARAPAARGANVENAVLVDQPLEPGSGRPRTPRGDAALADVVGTSAQPGAGDPQAIKANYIAAARRAVQAAAAEAQSAANAERNPKGKKSKTGSAATAGIKALIEKRKKPILLGLAAAIVAIGSIQVINSVLLTKPDLPVKPKVSTAQPEKLPTADPRAQRPAEVARAAETPAASEPRQIVAQPTLPPAASGLQQPAINPAVAQPPASAPALAEGPASTNGIGPGAAIAAQPPTPAASALAPATAVTGLPDLPASLGTAGLRNAVAKGDARAVFDLATRLADGRGVQRDPKLALKLFERSAAAGLVPAQFRVGNMYEKGIGTSRDIGLARLWYERAAEKGNAKAMHNLAVLYAEGATGKPDYPIAGEWFRKAAELGVRDSQFNLAILLARGLGSAQDIGQSYTWFSIAATQGDEEAGKKRDEVASQLQPADLAIAKQAAERWKAKPVDPAANEVALPAKGWDEPLAQPAPPKKPARNTPA